MLARTLLLRQDRDKITQLLGPAEQLLALTVFEVPDGKWRLEDPPDDRSGMRKAGDAAIGTAAFLVTGPEPPSLGKMLGGVSAAGHLGSWAHQVAAAQRRAGGLPYLVVTDKRLLLVSDDKSSDKAQGFAAFLDIPRDAVLNASRDGRPFARGRVVIAFTDGSMIALKLGSVLTGQADRLVNALTIPGAAPAT